MAAPMKTGLPPELELASGYKVQLLALDSSGNAVANVSLVDVSFFVTDLAISPATDSGGAPLPLLVPTDELV